MSMISAQADKLRERAKVLRQGRWSDGEEDARLMEYAADLILELRDGLQQANDENDKLREQLAKARDPQRIGGQADPSSFAYAIEQLREFRWQHATNDEDAIPYINNVAAAHERENAKLRALLSDALILTGFNERQYLDKYLREEEGTTLIRELKSVGIEVDA